MVVVLSQEERLMCRSGENLAFHDVEHCEKSDNILSDHQTRLLIGKNKAWSLPSVLNVFTLLLP